MTAETVLPSSLGDRRFAGWRLSTIAVFLLLLLAIVWGAWITRKLLEVEGRRTVSVSLSTLVSDFVAAEARSGGTPEQTQARTAAYLSALKRAVEETGRNGTVVLVTEAVLGDSVPDQTAAIRARVAAEMEAGNDR
jgi:hypothetical protein